MTQSRVDVSDFYHRVREQVVLLGDRSGGWRSAQLGALGATLAHWSLGRAEPTVVSIPTGSGKTAVAMAAPFLMSKSPRRVLVLAPARQIRHQLVDQFSTYEVLKRLAVVPEGAGAPTVFEMTGR